MVEYLSGSPLGHSSDHPPRVQGLQDPVNLQGHYTPSQMFPAPPGVPGGYPQFRLLLHPSGQTETETHHQLDERSHFNCDQGFIGPLELCGQRTSPEVDRRDLPQVSRPHVSSGPLSPAYDRRLGDRLGWGTLSTLRLRDLARFIPFLLNELAGTSSSISFSSTLSSPSSGLLRPTLLRQHQ